jgi:DNA-binding CsgD family transcriptional regulator
VDSLPQVATGDDGAVFGRQIAALQALLDTARTHAGVPAETRRCLDEMAACVLDLAVATARTQSATTAGPLGGRGGPDAGAVTAELRERGLREFVGADIIDQLAQGAAGSDAGPLPRLQQQSRSPLPRLTPQEQRILDLIAEGCTNRQIAGELFLAEKTVKNYVSNMLRKLGMERRTQAAVYAAHMHRATLAASSGTVA